MLHGLNRLLVGVTALLVLCTGAQALAHDVDELRRQADQAYAESEYVRSGELYESALELGAREALIAYNGACAYSLGDRAEDALRLLAQAMDLGFGDVELLLRDTDLDAIHEHPQWEDLVARCRARAGSVRRRWSSAALETPYRDDITLEEKVAGLSKFWSEAQFNFANFDLVPELDWDALYLEFLPRVIQTSSTLEYYHLLKEFCARLGDGHTNVYPPRALSDSVFARPPIRTRLVEDRVLVIEVHDEELEREGVVVSLEVVALDGTPVREYADERVRPYQSSSTPQDRDMRTYEQALLRGPVTRPVELTFESAAGERFRRSIPRWSSTQRRERVPPRPLLSIAWLPGNVAHVALNTLMEQATADSFMTRFSEIEGADALIVDLRNNGGGNSGVGHRILATLTREPFRRARWETMDYRPAFRAWGRAQTTYGDDTNWSEPDGSRYFGKPVVLLTSPRTFSAAEDFSVAFDFMERGPIIGEPTGGSTGQPLAFQLPGGLGGRVCTKRDRYPDGREFVGVGVLPDVVVHPTVADVRAGVDTVLEAALRKLQE